MPQTSQPLWLPSKDKIEKSKLKEFCRKKHFESYEDLYNWSVNNISDFWKEVWDFCGVISSTQGSILLKNENDIVKAEFFPEAKLNYAENLLRLRDDQIAIYSYNENSTEQHLTYKELYDQVSKLSSQFLEWGIKPGDCIAGYLPNISQTVVVTLAAATIGAIWSVCSPDFGLNGLVDRLGQIQPSVLVTTDGYFYNGKIFDCLDKVPDILKSIPNIKNVLIIPYVNKEISHPYHCFDKILQEKTAKDIEFIQLPFNHPLFILYSSGTTGIPKSIVHGAGGTLLQHLKEHQLHSDIQPNDKVFYYTTCGWMMWNWLISALASDAQIVLYDGSPSYPSFEHLFEIVEKIGITFFGTSAKYLSALQKNNFVSKHDLSSLKTIASTGSPLAYETFEYVYNHIKSDVHLASISGGTDIISCFILGNPILPVFAGQLQTAGLGMKVEVFDENGQALEHGQGELVCTKPFPSRPICFWNDQDNLKYTQAYFNRYPNIWHHGDFLERTDQNGFIIQGRSDSVLNPGGIRIGTAEIYRQVEQVDEVTESLAVGQTYEDDEHIILFVTLRPKISLDDSLIEKIKKQIRKNTTPRHVPAKIFEVKELPHTKTGKLAELAVRQVLHGKEVKNVEALANPNCLEQFKEFALL